MGVTAFCPLFAQQDKADMFFLEGHRQLLQGNNSDAFELFRHTLAIDPHHAPALEQMANYWHILRNDSMAVVYLQQAVNEDPDNLWYKESLVDMYVNNNKADEAIDLLEKILDEHPNKTDIMGMLLQLYKYKNDFTNVIKVLNRLELKEGKSEQLSMEKFRTFVQMKDEKSAFKEMSELAEEYPNDLRYKVLVGDLYMDEGKYDEALKAYKEAEADDPQNVFLMGSYLNYYSRTGQDSLYQQQIKEICTNPKLDSDTRLKFINSLIMQNLQNEEDTTHIMETFDKVLAMPQTDNQLTDLCVRYMIAVNAPQARVKPVLNQMLTIDPESTLARSQLLSYAVEANDTAEIIRVCEPAVDYSVDDPVFYYYLGIAYFQQDKAQQAVDCFKKGFAHVKDDSNLQLVTNMYALMGDCYHKLGNMKLAYEAYDSCLLYRPDEALVLNNYAYYLSLEEKQLSKAEEMSRRSLQKESENPTYIDTYAWILFKQKRYAEAKEQIDKALTLMGDSITSDDATVVEHAGDIYAKNKLMDQAMKYWLQSQQLGNGSALLLKKIKNGKYYAY